MERRLLLSLFLALLLAAPALAQGVEGLEQVPILRLPAVDLARQMEDDERRAARGQAPHFAAVLEVEADPWRHGTWEAAAGGQARWRLRLVSERALSLSLAFPRFELPTGARLTVTPSLGGPAVGPFTAADNESHGQLWTPPVLADDVVLELVVPVRRLDDVELVLGRVHHGYAGFGEPPGSKSGRCQQHVACGGSEWQPLSRSVGLVAIEGVRYCTGFLLNNSAQDGRPLLVTARHCGVDVANAASVVVMWNHQRSECGEAGELAEPARQFQTGARLLAVHGATDLVLLELDDPPSVEVVFAGWDRSDDDPQRAASIHHPNTDAKRLALDSDPVLTTAHLGDQEQRGGSHLRVGHWEVGTTEGGSSGAPLLNEDKRVVGWLHGGHAACGVRRADWYGRLSAAWDGPAKNRRLRDWLDPLDTQVLVLDALDGPVARGR